MPLPASRWSHKSRPSDRYLGAIVRAYRAAVKSGERPVTPSSMWDAVVIECLQSPGGFKQMFEWDSRKSGVNRIRDIAEVIAAGLVPGLQLSEDERGKWVVIEGRG